MLHQKIDMPVGGIEPHLSRYIRFIQSRLDTLRSDKYEKGVERHHIIPRCLAGSESPGNFIKLTSREHYVAHMLLWRAYRNRELAYAFRMMANRNGISVNGKQYAALRLSLCHSLTTKEKIRQAHIGLRASKEAKQKMSEGRRGFQFSEESKEKMSRASLGKSKSKEARKHMSVAKLGIHQSRELVEKRVQARLGYRHSEETKQKMSEKAKGRIPSEATRLASSLHNKGRPLSEEVKMKMRESQRKRRKLEKEKV